jgi:hypothetical protein
MREFGVIDTAFGVRLEIEEIQTITHFATFFYRMSPMDKIGRHGTESSTVNPNRSAS